MKRSERSRFGRLAALALAAALCAPWLAAERPAASMELRADAFADPPPAYRPSPFWAWNAKLEDTELRRQVREFKQRGFGGFFMHSRIGLATEYLSEDWYHKVAAAIAEAKNQGLEAWLYDEDRWPSGYAGGRITRAHPEYAGVMLLSALIEPAELEKAQADSATVALFALARPGGAVAAYRRLTSAADFAAGAEQILRFYSQPFPKLNRYNGEAFIDILNPAAVEAFFDLTLEGYRRRFGAEFGVAVPGIFTDEPNFFARGAEGLPWSPTLPDLFRQQRGYDLVDELPLLLYRLDGFNRVRYDYWRTLTERFEASFSRPYGERSGRIGLKLTGHYMNEDTLDGQTAVVGSVMVHYRHMQQPGIDHLMRNIQNPLTLKQVASVAQQYGRERTFSEVFGVTGHSVSFEDLKWISDYHFALGINFLCPTMALYSASGERKRDYPPTLSYHQPYWDDIGLINDYIARGSYFASAGIAQPAILLLHNLGSAWAFRGPGGEPEVERYQRALTETIETLLALQRDFHLGDETLLERDGRVVTEPQPQLRLGPQGVYRAVLVPPSFHWRARTVELLETFAGAGGRVIFLSALPTRIDARPDPQRWQRLSERASRIELNAEALESALQPAVPRALSVTDLQGQRIPALYASHRTEGARQLYFLANTSRDSSYRTRIAVPIHGQLTRWDLSSGAVQALEPESRNNSETILRHTFPPAGSLAFVVDTSQPAPAVHRTAKTAGSSGSDGAADIRTLAGPWRFERSQPNVLVLDRCRYALDGGAESGPVALHRARRAILEAAGVQRYAGLQPWALIEKGIEPLRALPLQLSFTFDSELGAPTASLLVEQARHFRIQINGETLAAASGDWFWDRAIDRIDLAGRIRSGLNTVALSTTYSPEVPIEPIYILGDFATRRLDDKSYALTTEPEVLEAGAWPRQGYQFYAGNMRYLAEAVLSDADLAHAEIRLRLLSPIGTAFKVRVNRGARQSIGWQPWELDIRRDLRAGGNRIEVEVLGSLQNAWGPLHNTTYERFGQNWWIGPQAFEDEADWSDDYYHYPYCLEGIELILH